MESLIFLFMFFWSGVIVATIVIRDLFVKKHNASALKWIVVISLSLVQGGCLRMFSGMSVIGNGGSVWSITEIIILLSPLFLLVAYWCDLQLRNEGEKSIINMHAVTAFKKAVPLLSTILTILKIYIKKAIGYIMKFLKYLNE